MILENGPVVSGLLSIMVRFRRGRHDLLLFRSVRSPRMIDSGTGTGILSAYGAAIGREGSAGPLWQHATSHQIIILGQAQGNKFTGLVNHVIFQCILPEGLQGE